MLGSRHLNERPPAGEWRCADLSTLGLDHQGRTHREEADLIDIEHARFRYSPSNKVTSADRVPKYGD